MKFSSAILLITAQLSAASNLRAASNVEERELLGYWDCKDVVLDFEKKLDTTHVFHNGEFLTDLGKGITVFAQKLSPDGYPVGQNRAMIFDTDLAESCGGDDDLLAHVGNAVIVSEDFNQECPDDNWKGGLITFQFTEDKPKRIKEIELLDVDKTDVTGNNRGDSLVYGTRSDGSTFGEIEVPIMGDGEIQWIFPEAATDVAELNIRFAGSGAIPEMKLEFCDYVEIECPPVSVYPRLKKCEVGKGEVKIEFESEHSRLPDDSSLYFKSRGKEFVVDIGRGSYDDKGKKFELSTRALDRLDTDYYEDVYMHMRIGDGDQCQSKRYWCDNKNLTPIGLDLDGSGTVEAIRGEFMIDIDGDHFADILDEWFAPTEGILIDASLGLENGIYGEHLFGDLGGKFQNGFDKLAKQHDSNGDGVVSGAELNGLAVWMDANSNAKLDDGEISSLESHAIVSINTQHEHLTSSATLTDGSTMVVQDLIFARSKPTKTS
jgi:hypothetical protein